tara:strand:+ start:1456 stop:1644 length:189 start_codon:yes stop_codon:yes gene_type:complete
MKKQIKYTMEILKNWDCLKDLAESDKQYIEWQLNFIADQAISEYRKKIKEVGEELLLTNKNK